MFVVAALMNFGGTNGIKGNMTHMNEIPFAALDQPSSSVWGSGFTSEGIDQNAALYDFLIGQNWREKPVESVPDYLITRAHRKFNLRCTSNPLLPVDL